MTAAILALVLSAHATQVGSRVLPCPLGSGTAVVYEKLAANMSGGYDSDLAVYSSGGQWRTYQIASCDDSLFTLYGSDMREAVPAADRERLAKVLAGAVAELPDRAHPTVWERYGIAAALYEAMGRSDLFLADLWLQASWTVRDGAVGYYEALSGPVQARALLDAGWNELKKPMSTENRGKVLYNLARVAHRGGWGAERDAMLAAFEANGGLDEVGRASLARFRQLAGEVEPRLQDAAIARYSKALRGELTHLEKVRASYALADLLRRRGRPREALPLFFVVANDKDAPDENVRGLALYLANLLADELDPKTIPQVRPH